MLVTSVLGCSAIPAIQRKFTRKKPYQPPSPIALTTHDYDLRLSPEERYRNHWGLLEFWQSELLEGLGESRKKALRATEEATNELRTLQSLLAPEKAQQLSPHIERLIILQRELTKNVMSATSLYRWRNELERQRRLIHHDFAFKRVQDELIAPSMDH